MRNARIALDGKLTISRSSGHDGSHISISIEDQSSGCHILIANMSLEAFAAAVTGLGYQPCKLDYFSQEAIGKKREVKTEFVPGDIKFTKDKTQEIRQKAKLLKPFEVDGWIGHAEDLGNYHKHRVVGRDLDNEGVSGFDVVFIRFV